MELKKKLSILSDAAKYDAACTSSGVSRSGKNGILEVRLLAVSVTAFRRTEDAFRSLKFL